jgi:Na+/melibiose symporter-like transporter
MRYVTHMSNIMYTRLMKRHRGLHILFSISTLMTFVLGIFAPFYSLYVLKLGGNTELAGLSWAIFSIISGVFMLILRKWETSIRSKKRLYAFGYLMISVTFFLYLYISNIYHLFFVQILFGISVALINPSFDALFSKHTDKDKEIYSWGGWEGVTAIAGGGAAIIGGIIIQNQGFSIVFFLMSLISLCVGTYLLSVPDDVL